MVAKEAPARKKKKHESALSRKQKSGKIEKVILDFMKRNFSSNSYRCPNKIMINKGRLIALV